MSTNDHSLKGTRAKVRTPAAGAPPPSGTYAIQRRGTRVLMHDPAPVQLHLRGADLLDISLSGALVEHTVGVRVGEVYRLFFPVEGVEVEVLARAVRSFVSRVAPVAGGEGQLVYRTGLEFIELKESMAKTLTAYIDDLHQQAVTRRSVQLAAQVPEGRTRVPNRRDANKGVAARPGGRGNAVPVNQLTRSNPERRAWNRWSLAGVLILGSVLVSSLLYVGGTDIHMRWGPPRALATAAPVPAAAMASTGGEPTSGLPSGIRGWAESELARLGLVTAQQGSMMPVPIESVVAQVLGSFSQPMQAGAGLDLWPPLSDLSLILGLRVSLPQWPPAGDKGDSQPGVTEITVTPTLPQPSAEPPVSQAGNGAPDPSSLLSALPPSAPTRPESSSVPTLRERTPPSRRVQPAPESPSPRQDTAPRKLANLRGVDLRGADLRGADLQGADLTGARLAWARLTGAKLQGATLQAADLTEADLWMADLRGADLQNADLRGAKLTPGDQAAKEGEAASEAIAMMPTSAEARPGIPAEILDPRRSVAERPREQEAR